MMILLIVSALALTSSVWAQDETGPIVEISTGSVLGKFVETHYGINVTSFWGIPYGAPPNGSLRFEVRI